LSCFPESFYSLRNLTHTTRHMIKNKKQYLHLLLYQETILETFLFIIFIIIDKEK